MRIFIAAEIDEAVRRKAAGLAATLASALERGGARRAVAFVAPENLHLTLQFLGEIDPASAKEVAGRLAPPFDTPAFDVAVAGLGTFPPTGRPRVIWLGVGAGAAQMSALYREVAARLDGLGFPADSRPFHAHVTLGRVKAPCGPLLQAAMMAAGAADSGRCRIDRVTIFESRLSQAGSTYSVVATSPLGYHHT